MSTRTIEVREFICDGVTSHEGGEPSFRLEGGGRDFSYRTCQLRLLWEGAGRPDGWIEVARPTLYDGGTAAPQRPLVFCSRRHFAWWLRSLRLIEQGMGEMFYGDVATIVPVE